MSEQETDKQESFLGRWARLKQKRESEPPAPEASPAQASSPAGQTQPVPQAQETGTDNSTELPAADEPGTDQDATTADDTTTDLPPLDSLTPDSDFSPFMAPEVSTELRRLALRKLFHSSAFNHRDGLDEYDDDYTQFTKLGNTITRDMKHMAAVEARRQLEATRSPQTTGETTMKKPRDAALAQLESLQTDPAGQVEYQSQGRVLVIGGENALQTAARVEPPLQPQVLLTTASELAAGQSFVTEQGERELQLSGWLGAFTAQLQHETGKLQVLQADLVLDLSPEPLLSQPLKPPGYFHAQDPVPDSVLTEMAALEGTFAKPRYFAYNPDICAHSSSGLAGCTRCIEACPAEAIISIGEKIQVEPHLCQGGGTCATVCPSGAIRYDYPAPAHQVNQMRAMLKAWREAGGEDVALLFYGSETALDTDALPDTILPFMLEELASAGAELWAAALSFGAKQVLLLDDETVPSLSRQHLRHQLSILNTQLAGLGYPDETARLIPALPVDTAEWAAALAITAPMPYFPPATQGGSNDKRLQWLAALDHLYRYATQPRESIPLPAGAPFGRIKVDQDSCTLCMACTTICPAQALSGGTDSPQLKLHPANCVQCGLCATGCPEQAITLEPVLIANREVRQRSQLLHEEPAFLCISCGKPFASQTVIQSMLTKLQGHYMFQNERARQRLKMCEDCRVVDIVQDETAMGQPGLKN